MKVAIGNDHTVIELRNIIEELVEGKGYEIADLETNSTESYDYPIYDEKVGWAVADGQAGLGITICDTGADISLTADKVKGIRACVCNEPYAAKLFRVHNNSNVPAFSIRVVGSELTKVITEAWPDAELEDGKHKHRVSMIMETENR